MRAQAQLMSCPNHVFYYTTSTGFIYGYDPDLPTSLTNPMSTGISNPPGGGGLTFMPSINGGTFSPTFYSVISGVYNYWNGSTWTSTGHTAGTSAVNMAGCGSYIFNFAGPNSVYIYNGLTNGSLLTTLSITNPSYDLVADCECNFYVLSAFNPNQYLTKFNSSGVVIAQYSLTGLPNASGGAGFAIMGNDIYYPQGTTWYKGTIGSGTVIPFSTISVTLTGNNTGDFASCPNSVMLAGITGSLNVTGILCPGQPVSIAATTTAGAVTYSWSGPGIVGSATNSAISAASAGVYTCVLTTTVCPQSVTLTTTLSSGPCITVTSNSITCASLGSATVVSTYGTGPFSYTWMPGSQTNSVATGLSPGTYTISVFDAFYNSTFTATTVFTSLIPLTGNINNSSSITCNGAATGTGNVTSLNGGSNSQNYLWTNGITSYTAPNPTNLTAGNYTVIVTDALTGCTLNGGFFISEPPPLVLTLASNTPTACAGASIVLTGTNSGGTPYSPAPAYNYTWTSGPASATNVVSQAIGSAFVYTLNSSDANGCMVSNTIGVSFVANPPVGVANVSICPLQTATLMASGASSYTWTYISGTPAGNLFTANPLTTTQYTVLGSALGCTSVATASIILKSVPVVTASANSPLCNGSSLKLLAGGGVTYSWSGPALFSSAIQNPTVNPVTMGHTGVFSATATAVNGCTAAANTTVIVNPTPSLSALGSTVCTNQVMNLYANSVAGATYSWTGPQAFTSGLQNIAINSPAVNRTGNYTVIATSIAGCTNVAIANVVVVNPPNLSVSLNSPTACAQALSGSPNVIILNSSGATTYTLATPAHIYNSNPSGPSSPLSMLPPFAPTGQSTATLTGSNGVCSASITSVFTIVPNPTVSVNSSTPVICAGETFTYTSAGANSYSWSAANPNNYLYTTGNVAVANPSISSVFSVVGGSLGCLSALESSTLSVNPLPVFNITGNPLICPGTSAFLVATGTGTLYNWSPNVFLNTAVSASVMANPPSVQNYLVTGSLNNCTTTAMITVSVLPQPTAVISAPQTIFCQNENIILTGAGGVFYTWKGPSNYSATGQVINVPALSSGYGGLYTLTVSDMNNCKGSTTQAITVNNLPQGYLVSSPENGCTPFCAEFKFKQPSGVAVVDALTWQIHNINFSGSTFTYCIDAPGDHKITGVLTDINGCVNTITAQVNGNPRPEADFYFKPELPVEDLDEVQFQANTKDVVSYNWQFGSALYKSTKKDPVFLFANAGSYPVALVVKNQWQCSDTIVKVVHVENDLAIYVPNAFTPNEDGLNELFMPVMRGNATYTLSVFDRWGAKVFESGDQKRSWDGTYKGELCKTDIYAWKLTIKKTDGASKELSGHVNLIR